MDSELLEKITIKFSVPLIEAEIEPYLIGYLRNKIPCEILYGRIDKENKSISFEGNIRTPSDSYIMINLRFKIDGDYHPNIKPPIFLFKSIEFKNLEYDGIERKLQLKFIDEVRQKIEEYFSQRPK